MAYSKARKLAINYVQCYTGSPTFIFVHSDSILSSIRSMPEKVVNYAECLIHSMLVQKEYEDLVNPQKRKEVANVQ